jgi:GT2 family glycosyltransferase
MIAVLVLTHNQKDVTLACLATLADQTTTYPSQTFIWDNASTDGTLIAVQEQFPAVHTHFSSENMGVAGGRNALATWAMGECQPTYLLFLDNDMLLEPTFVGALLAPLLADKTVGQTQAKLRFTHDRTRLNDGGGAQINFMTWQVTPVGYNEVDRGQYDQIKPCISCGGAMMVRSSLFQTLNGFDTTFNPFGPEDLDFSLRLQKLGYTALYVPDAVAYHTVSHTFGKGYSAVYARHKSRHWLAFMRRHASWGQMVGFVLVGAPLMGFKMVVREGKKGNWGAVRGLVRGLWDGIWGHRQGRTASGRHSHAERGNEV